MLYGKVVEEVLTDIEKMAEEERRRWKYKDSTKRSKFPVDQTREGWMEK